MRPPLALTAGRAGRGARAAASGCQRARGAAFATLVKSAAEPLVFWSRQPTVEPPPDEVYLGADLKKALQASSYSKWGVRRADAKRVRNEVLRKGRWVELECSSSKKCKQTASVCPRYCLQAAQKLQKQKGDSYLGGCGRRATIQLCLGLGGPALGNGLSTGALFLLCSP